jgi:hypothetical protein
VRVVDGAVTRLAQTRPLRAVALPVGCWWQDVDTPKTHGRPGWRCAARWARTPTGRSAAGSTGLCRPGCRWPWPRCGPRPTWCCWSRHVGPGRGGALGRRPRPGRWAAGAGEFGRQWGGWGGGPAPAPGLAAGALLDGVLDRVGDAADLAGLGLWGRGGRGGPVRAGTPRRRAGTLDGHDAQGVLVLTVAATTEALLSMASKDRAAALGLPPAPERTLGWAARRPGRAAAASRCGRGPGRGGRGPGRHHGHRRSAYGSASSAARPLATWASGGSRPGWVVSSGVRLTCAEAMPVRSGRWPAR